MGEHESKFYESSVSSHQINQLRMYLWFDGDYEITFQILVEMDTKWRILKI